MCCDSYIGKINRLRLCNIVFVYIVQVINFVYNKELYLEWDSNMKSFITYMYL